MSAKKTIYFYTGRFTHTFYKELFKHVPVGFEFIPSTADLIDQGMKSDIKKSGTRWGKVQNQLEHALLQMIEASRWPNIKVRRFPKGMDLIHSAQAALWTNHPWVVDFENVTVFTWFSRKVMDGWPARHWLKKIFEQESCRLVLPWTEAAKNSLLNAVDCRNFEAKIEVAYPVMQPKPFPNPTRKRGKPFHFLTIGTAFYAKGILETLKAFELVQSQAESHLTVISYIPPEIQARYGENPNITLLSRVPNERIEQAYREADAFVYPAHTDTFGFVLLEAFSYGIPCVASDLYAIPEIVQEGVNGRLIPRYASFFDEKQLPQYPRVSSSVNQENHPLIRAINSPSPSYVQALATAMIEMMENPQHHEAMAAAAYETVRTGRFSVEARKRRMGELYQRALA